VDTNASSIAGVSDEQALAALLAAAQPKQLPGQHATTKKRSTSSRDATYTAESQSYYGPRHQDTSVPLPSLTSQSLKRTRWGEGSNIEKDASNHDRQNGREEPRVTTSVDPTTTTASPAIASKPNFGLSGALATDDSTGNVNNGILLKFSEPPEARAPNTRWRLYVFRKTKTAPNTTTNKEFDDSLNEVLHISKQSAYLFGRERKVADIAVDHPSLSKQHCVLQYRALPDKNDPEQKLRCKPYLMDLASTNGTFINGVRLEEARYYELRKGDVITLGASSREYVLLTENTTRM